MIKKLFLTTIAALTLVASTVLGAEQTGLYTANEFSAALSSAVQLGHSYDANLSGNVQYFITKNIGLDATLPFYQTSGISVDHVAFGGVFRLPISIFAPYAGAGAVYNWQDSNWGGYAKAGVELRVRKYWGIFGQAEYDFSDVNSSFTKGTWLVGGGVRLVLW